MTSIIEVLYLLILFFFILMGLFISYHLVKYSYDKKSAFVVLVIFIAVAGMLLFSNVVLFLHLPINEIIGNTI